jgi:hypothetical protein
VEHGLPTIPILAELGPGSAESWSGNPGTLPHEDLFIKQAAASAVAGAGAECWIYDGSGECWTRNGERLGDDALLDRLRRQGARARILVQPRVRNHERIAGFSLKALCSIRAVTVRQPRRSATHFRSCLRMPAGAADVDHPVHGGLAAPIRPGGILGPAVANVVGPPFRRHPATGAQIEGSRVPYYEEAVSLAVRAHDLLDIDAAIGWDIAITPDGPVFLESNSGWGTDVMQTSFDEPLGLTDLVVRLQDLIDASRRAEAR